MSDSLIAQLQTCQVVRTACDSSMIFRTWPGYVKKDKHTISQDSRYIEFLVLVFTRLVSYSLMVLLHKCCFPVALSPFLIFYYSILYYLGEANAADAGVQSAAGSCDSAA